MIIYFADRQLNIIGTASTHLPEGIVILDDEKKEDIESGVKTFSVTLAYDGKSRDLIRENVAVGNFLLRSADDENEFYTIIQTEHDAQAQTVEAYCEDAGLDLLNTIAPAYENTTTHSAEWYVDMWLPEGWEIRINELEGNQVLSWDGESTVTERLLSIANGWGGEVGFSYEIERLTITKKYVDLYAHRGSELPVHQLRLGYDIDNIKTNTTIENLATAFSVTGGTPSGKSAPINLVGADYSSDGHETHSPAVATDDYQIINGQVRCLSAMERWSSELDGDGLLIRQYSYDTTNKRELFSHAVAELRKVVSEETTYDIEFVTFPRDAVLGDRVHVVDDKNDLYLEGRILSLTKSITQDQTKATLGEFIIKESGISERLAELANELRQRAVATTVITLSSDNGVVFSNNLVSTVITVTLFFGNTQIINQSGLDAVFGEAELTWYKDGVQISSTPTHLISNDGFTLELVNENINETAKYEVVLEV